MVADVKVIGLRGDASFDDMVRHFTSLGGEVVIMDPMYICGKDHVISAVRHAERSFEHGTNRSKTLLTEILLYAAGERQISKALEKMRPKAGCKEYALALLDVPDDLRLNDIEMERDDLILNATDEKADKIGLDRSFNIPIEDLALEMVALLDLAKY
ncbi:MAG: hypothetical protein IK043_00605 [Candidatus Methanomethylophilaceae archaeon]|nr:hypothetical protein [Candidatus Methanomethylophilaceae archaeon]